MILNNIMSTGRYLRGIQDHNNVAGDAFLAMLRSLPLEYILISVCIIFRPYILFDSIMRYI